MAATPHEPRRSRSLALVLAVSLLAVIAAGVAWLAYGSYSDRSDRSRLEAIRAEWTELVEQGDREQAEQAAAGRPHEITDRAKSRGGREWALIAEYDAIKGRHPEWAVPPLR